MSVFPSASYVPAEKIETTPIENTLTTHSNNDVNNNKIQDGFEEELKKMNATDNVNVHVTLVPRDEGFIKFSENCGAKVREFYTIIDAAALTVSVENVTKLASYPAVEMIYNEDDERMEVGMDSCIPALYGDRATLRSAGFDVDGSGTTIAILDSGVSVRTSLQTLPDGKTPKIVAWMDAVGGAAQPFDDNGHGTNMASIAAAVGRSSYFPGVAPGAQLVIVRCMSGSGGGTITPMYNGLQWILNNKDKYGIDVLSMSVRIFYNEAKRLDGNDGLDQAVEKLVSAGITVAVLAGNEGANGKTTIGVPGTARNVITVGGVDDSYNLCSFSSRGPTADGRIKPDLCAVGYDVRTINSVMSVFTDGTSEATPQVAGTVSLLHQYHDKQVDKYNSATAKSAMKLTPAMIKDIVTKSASQPSKGAPYPNNGYGNGVLNIKGALTALKNKNYLPMAKFTTSGDTNTSSAITFDASESFDPNGDALTYSWDFGDGTTGSGKTVNHTYSTQGDFTVTLTVKDSKNNANEFGASATVINQLTITKKSLAIGSGNKLPIASVMANEANINKGDILNFSINEVISLDASKSTDPDGQVASVSWNMGDGSPAKTGKTVTHTYTAEGTYSVVAKLTDDKSGETQFPFSVVIANKPPTAKISVNTQNVNKSDTLKYSIGEELTFDASKSTDIDGQVASVSWDMGGEAQESGKTVKYTFTTEGSYDVVAKLTDDKGAETTFAFTIDIGNGPPIAAIKVNGAEVSSDDTITDITANKEIAFDASQSYDREGSIKSVSWDMGDGKKKSGLTVKYAYT
ncbi:MAG: PKD domain-containing protein, partial [Thermoplasmata archaeon]